MKRITTKTIRADVVGSMLRPSELLLAQDLRKKHQVAESAVTLAEDEAIRDAVIMQEQADVDVITDGELRRPVFCHNLVGSVDGFAWNVPGNTVIWFSMDGQKMIDPVTVGVVSKIKQIHDVSAAEFAFLRGIAHKPTKITIPSPTMMTYFFMKGISNRVYKRPMAFLDDVTRILKKTVEHLESLGATYIQVDAPEFGMLLDPLQREWFEQKGFNPNFLVENGVERINEIFRGFNGIRGLHICRGNDKNRFMARGGYDLFAKTLFQKPKVDRLLLEFDSDRAGTFDSLRCVSEDKTVVLGLITTKSSVLDDANVIKSRITDASKFIPLNRLALSTQCGFASVAKGNNMTMQDQEKKLHLVADVAHDVWA